MATTDTTTTITWECGLCGFEAPTEAGYRLHWDLAVAAETDKAIAAGEGDTAYPLNPDDHPHAYRDAELELAHIDDDIGGEFVTDQECSNGHPARYFRGDHCPDCGREA